MTTSTLLYQISLACLVSPYGTYPRPSGHTLALVCAPHMVRVRFLPTTDSRKSRTTPTTPRSLVRRSTLYTLPTDTHTPSMFTWSVYRPARGLSTRTVGAARPRGGSARIVRADGSARIGSSQSQSGSSSTHWALECYRASYPWVTGYSKLTVKMTILTG